MIVTYDYDAINPLAHLDKSFVPKIDSFLNYIFFIGIARICRNFLQNEPIRIFYDAPAPH